ncbi:MAG: hypothetical protein NZ561_06650 [Phycisphaerae bacterium]|nr:hypothetical protein [Phycisphaerae bacterium]MDW8263219.1 hypothetical protein [Phycisphaerales bacterium]
MPLGRFIVFIAALVLIPAAWAEAPVAPRPDRSVCRISTIVEFHREAPPHTPRNSAGSLRSAPSSQIAPAGSSSEPG